jgi:hypothetical protein
MKQIYAVLAAFALALIGCSGARATDFWVATTGSDSASGTQAAPFLTIGHADAAGVTGFGPGSTIHVAPGTYLGAVVGKGNGSGATLLNTSGTAAAPITYLCDVKWSCRIAPTASETTGTAIGSGGSNGGISISAISSTSTNCSGTPPCIQVTLSAAAPFLLFNNEWVAIDGVATNTVANGMWQITVVDQTHVTLNGSAFLNSAGAAGEIRVGATASYTIWDGFEIDGTYPGTGTQWHVGIQLGGTGSIIRNMKAHDLAYWPINGGQGACIADTGYYGASNIVINNNLVYHCGQKGVTQSQDHGIYVQTPGVKIFNNIVWGVSGECISTWHDATYMTIVNNTLLNCLDDAISADEGGQDWPHIVTGTPANGSNIITGISSTAGIRVGAGILDTTQTACVGPNDYSVQVTSVDSSSQVHISANAGSSCGSGDTINFTVPNTNSYIANNIVKNGSGNNLMLEFGNVGVNTWTNNNVTNAFGGTWGLKNSTHVNDALGDPAFVRFIDNDGINSDYHLKTASPAIAAGIATNAPTFDFDGNPVPLGTAVDIGAYAYNPRPHATIDKFWNWVAQGFSAAFHKAIYAASTATTQSTNGVGGQTRIFDLGGIGDVWANGGLTIGGGRPVSSVIGSGAYGWTNTAISTSEVNLVSVPYPALGATDAIEISALFERGGTLSDTVHFVVRLATAGGSCTPGSACSTGSVVSSVVANTASQVALDEVLLVTNSGAPGSQIVRDTTSPLGLIGATPATLSVQTNAGGFINIDCSTDTSTSDTCKLDRYSIQLVPGKP